ncbi:MAG: RNA polymerase sigma factor [Bacteroidales bacterium]|jgi:RNA polymerase sigma-70 factor (ECF subfamily)|nr:RNA polymerase sigma factor [Bacteroidales bacterium]
MNKQLEEQFLEAFDRNKNRIYKICFSYCNSYDDAKDLFQEVLMNIWRSMPQFKGESAIDTWIFRITINVCLRIKTKQNRDRDVITRLNSIDIEDFREHIQNSPDNEQIAALYNCIKQLNDTDKSIILLYLEDMAYREISDITGLSENNIAVKIKRIKKRLLTCLNAEGYEK